MKLKEIAVARSGDKGSHANIGVIARKDSDYEKLKAFLTEEKVATYFSLLKPTKVIRYELPNLSALNFILENVLEGGASLNLKVDAQGKALGQLLLEIPLQEK